MSNKNHQQATILIVDDNEDILSILVDALECHTSFQVITATCAQDGLKILASQRIDVIILDLVMPEMDGIEMFKIIKDRSINTPVMFLTGRSALELENIARELGAFDFIQKPVNMRDLLLLIDEAYKVVQQIRAILSRNVS